MTRSLTGLFMLALAGSAGCPAPAAAPQMAAQPVAPAAGCPAADGVFVASFMTQEDRAAGHTGWVLPLHNVKADTAGAPEYEPHTAAQAAAAGVPVAPTNVWLMVPGQAPCRAAVGGYYRATVESPIPNSTYGVELTGCAAPPDDQQDDAEALALASAAMPGDCQILAPQQVAARLGETDAQKAWQRPTKETPMPPAFAAALPPHDCRPPGCETLWSIAQVDVASRPVAWAGAVNWLTIPPNATAASQCDWKADTFAGFFVPGPDGRAVKVTEGQDHPLLLAAVLADRTGPRLLVAEGPGEYAIYDPTGRLVRRVAWLTLPPEAYTIDERIGPSCDEEHH